MELHRETTVCPCGHEITYVAEWPPIPAIVVRFVGDDGEPLYDDCNCGAPLVVPTRMPEPGTYMGAMTGIVQDQINAEVARRA